MMNISSGRTFAMLTPMLAFASLLASASALGDELADRLASIPNPRSADGSWVADPANVIARRRPEINRLIDGLERSTSVEIAVAVVPTIGGIVPKDFAVALFSKWGVGKAGKDNGVLVLHVLDQRRIEIETGYGMEGDLPDAKCKWITRDIAAPYFRSGSFADGHLEVVRALIRAIQNPSIGHDDLVRDRLTAPGQAVEPLPRIERHDDISLRYASLPTKVVHASATAPILFASGIAIYALLMRRFRRRTQDLSPQEKYQRFSKGFTRWQYASGIPIAAAVFVAQYANTGTGFAAVPVLIAALGATFLRRRQVLRQLRDAPRRCECGNSMRRLSEDDDDRYLSRGNIAEESIASMEYDVWVCDCGKHKTELYAGRAQTERCPKCSFKTFRTTRSRVLRVATTISTGLREVTFTCAHCNHSVIDTSIIPIVSTPSCSSGHGSGGSRSGGSFGGGRSGGGGAGSSY